jgi:hypothetical protein
VKYERNDYRAAEEKGKEAEEVVRFITRLLSPCRPFSRELLNSFFIFALAGIESRIAS